MRFKSVAVAAVVAGLPLAAALSQERDRSDPQIARGKYLVEEIAQCGMCHTPRNERGEFEPGRCLRGGPLEFEPTHAVRDWPTTAPPIAGLPGWSREQAIRFLETGVTPNGIQPLRPMPQYRIRHDDAVAMVAYLKLLKTGPG